MPVPHHSIFRGQMPFLPPNQQRQSNEGSIFVSYTIHNHYDSIYAVMKYPGHVCCIQCFDAVGWAAGMESGLQKTEWWGTGMVICLRRGADLQMASWLMPLPLTVSCSSKSRLVLPSRYQLIRVVPDKGPLNGCSSSSRCHLTLIFKTSAMLKIQYKCKRAQQVSLSEQRSGNSSRKCLSDTCPQWHKAVKSNFGLLQLIAADTLYYILCRHDTGYRKSVIRREVHKNFQEDNGEKSSITNILAIISHNLHSNFKAFFQERRSTLANTIHRADLPVQFRRQ